jgi:hypothetical protein
MAAMIGKARSNPRVRRLATAALGASRFKTAETRDLSALRRQLASARNPHDRNRGCHVSVRFSSKRRRFVNHRTTRLLRMAEGIFDFIRETNSLAGALLR